MSIQIQDITGSKSKISKSTFEIAPYSPVFIGSGFKLRNKLDFFSSQAKTHVFDLNKLIRDRIDDMDALEAAMLRRDMPAYIQDAGLKTSDYLRKSYMGDCKSEELASPLSDGLGRPIIPGSSIKGSIRSALFAYFLEKRNLNEEQNLDRYLDLISRRDHGAQRRGKGKFPGRDLEEFLLSTFNRKDRSKRGTAPSYDIGRVLRVGDATFSPDSLEVFNIAVINEVSNGFQWFVRKERGKSINDASLHNANKIGVAGISYDPETTRPSHFSMSLDHSALESIGWKESFDVKVIAHACNTTSKKVLQDDLHYVTDAMPDQPDLSMVRENLEELVELVEELEQENRERDKSSWLQRIGWGSGYLSMTGAHATPQMVSEIQKIYNLGRQGFEYPKTRRIALDLNAKPSTLMGWVVVEQQ